MYQRAHSRCSSGVVRPFPSGVKAASTEFQKYAGVDDVGAMPQMSLVQPNHGLYSSIEDSWAQVGKETRSRRERPANPETQVGIPPVGGAPAANGRARGAWIAEPRTAADDMKSAIAAVPG